MNETEGMYFVLEPSLKSPRRPIYHTRLNCPSLMWSTWSSTSARLYFHPRLASYLDFESCRRCKQRPDGLIPLHF